MNTITPFLGADETPRTYFDRLFAGLDVAEVQAFADRALAQLAIEADPARDLRRATPAAKPPAAGPVAVLRIALSCARSIGVVPSGSRAAREEARRQLAEGRFILWPPEA